MCIKIKLPNNYNIRYTVEIPNKSNGIQLASNSSIELHFDSGTRVIKYDNMWLITRTEWKQDTRPTNFGKIKVGVVNNIYSTEELLCMVNDNEKIEFLKNIKYFNNICIMDFLEDITNQDLKDFIIFNLDLITG